jgi:MFS family permease
VSPTKATRRIAVLAFIGGLGGGLVFPIIPALGLQLGIPAFMVGLILSANRISRLIFNVPAGHLISRLGPRLTLGGALFVESVGVLSYSAALHFGNAMWWLLAGRAVFGIGTAFLFVGGQAFALSLSVKADRGRQISTVRVAMSAAMPAGLVIGGILADRFSDDAAFLTGAAITFLGALLAIVLLPRFAATAVDDTGNPIPRGGFATLRNSPGFPFIAAAWGFNLLVFLTVQGVLLATLVILVQKRQIYLFGMQAQGTSGLLMAILIACSALVAFYIGHAIDRMAWRSTLIAPSLVVLASGFVLVGMAPSLALLILGTILIGLSYNGVTLPMMALLGDVTRKSEHGPAVGFYQLFGDIGGTIGPIAGIEIGVRAGLGPLYEGVAALLVLAILTALWVRQRERRL